MIALYDNVSGVLIVPPGLCIYLSDRTAKTHLIVGGVLMGDNL